MPDKKLLEELNDLKLVSSEKFLKRLKKIKEENPPLYDEIIKALKKEETSEEPANLIDLKDGFGPKQLTSEEAEAPKLKNKSNKLLLILAVSGLIILIIVFIIFLFL
ncbi:hypothetical protein COX58_02925 [archaeon CG_4_10_14_0_2_um_filter_Archaea_38_6]|nr:MAG: hypothetical protein COS64_02815 [archaeon CG06_land_8_20_14_3_00_37_11]PIX42795.1 MAG: hypothetical protein COZ55_01760 [archaeon CG_4_8_14_3_um_filter_38_5]PJA22046.1 MAG: hypothetical protein COX58_02925 [archaeon CG_4_10_14_0_2_um_filter_Archaea_38_6]